MFRAGSARNVSKNLIKRNFYSLLKKYQLKTFFPSSPTLTAAWRLWRPPPSSKSWRKTCPNWREKSEGKNKHLILKTSSFKILNTFCTIHLLQRPLTPQALGYRGGRAGKNDYFLRENSSTFPLSYILRTGTNFFKKSCNFNVVKFLYPIVKKLQRYIYKAVITTGNVCLLW